MNKLYLSKRNLQTLLNKLNRDPEDSSACTLIKYKNPGKFQQTLDAVAVTAVPDEEYYDRLPGEVHEKDDPSTLKDVAGIAYQIIGVLSGKHEDIFDSDEVERVLDYFSSIVYTGQVMHENPLPFHLPDKNK